jgi:hypothetical protein
MVLDLMTSGTWCFSQVIASIPLGIGDEGTNAGLNVDWYSGNLARMAFSDLITRRKAAFIQLRKSGLRFISLRKW